MSTDRPGKLILIPIALHENSMQVLLPSYLETLTILRHFITENTRTSRRFLRSVIPDFNINDSTFWELDKHNSSQSFSEVIQTLMNGHDVGLMSEAGCPGIADPGSKVVLEAHKHGITVIPWIGPSSILLSLMASGLNGQNFTFHGYLPSKSGIELKNKIIQLEQTSLKTGGAQLFIETPYRNESLFKVLVETLKPTTLLHISIDLTSPDEIIKTLPIAEWKTTKIDLHKKTAIFVIQAV